MYTESDDILEVILFVLNTPWSLWQVSNKPYLETNDKIYDIFLTVSYFGWFGQLLQLFYWLNKVHTYLQIKEYKNPAISLADLVAIGLASTYLLK